MKFREYLKEGKGKNMIRTTKHTLTYSKILNVIDNKCKTRNVIMEKVSPNHKV